MTTSTCHGSQRLAVGIAVVETGDEGTVLADDAVVADSNGFSTMVPLLMTILMLAGLLSRRLIWRRGA